MAEMNKTKRLAFMALLTAMALTIFVLEAQIPAPIPVPGVKLGLSNVITLTAMLLLGRREAVIVLLLRIIMGAMFTGSPSALIYSISGGVLAYAVMCLLIKAFPEKLVWVVSALAAVAHNVGQITAAAFVVKTPALFTYYLPILAAAGIVTGVFTGIVATYLVRALRKVMKK